MKKLIRPSLRIPALIATLIVLAPLATYAIAVTVGADQWDCVPQRFRQPDSRYSATYAIHTPDGRTFNHLDAPGLSIPGYMIQTGTVEGCTYYGQPLLERLWNTPYCLASRAIETNLQ